MTGRFALVTGASRGLGRALCELMVERGEEVVGISRSESDLTHPLYRHVIKDISVEMDVVALFSELRTLGSLALLVNNAGISLSRPTLLTSASAFDSVLRTNLLGAFVVTREALKTMKRQRQGRIVNISSINVRLASPGAAAYNASKAGLELLGRTLANEILVNEDITINSLGVSIINGTGMAEQLSKTAVVQKTAHLSRPALIEAQEVLAAIDFFSSLSARNITGQTLYFGGVD